MQRTDTLSTSGGQPDHHGAQALHQPDDQPPHRREKDQTILQAKVQEIEGRAERLEGVAVDAGGNVHVADTNNHRIQELPPGG